MIESRVSLEDPRGPGNGRPDQNDLTEAASKRKGKGHAHLDACATADRSDG
jgi:hypothetical protein